VQSLLLFWPSNRKLFRQRSRLRGVALGLALVAAVVLAATFAGAGWQ
jgi:hypothetical protein